MGTFGRIEIEVPRARRTDQRQNHGVEQPGVAGLPAPHAGADALIAALLGGTNTRRVAPRLEALFGGAVGKDTVSRVWRK